MARNTDAARELAIRAEAQADLYFFARYMFRERRGYKWLHNWHHRLICDALMRVYRGETTRLIINIPPRYSKTELAVVNFMAWCLGHAPDSEFIYTSYSGRLASNYSYETRGLIQHPAYARVFPDLALMQNSSAKDEWRTSAGGLVYAVGAGGTITGYGAGKERPEFGGCFPVGTRVWTERGLMPIDQIVYQRMAIRVWAFDYQGRMVLRPVVGWHENPPNEIVRVGFSDGAVVECTPDHRFWTENRGWVRADSLCIEDRLPCVHGGVEGTNHIGIDTQRLCGGLESLAILAPCSGHAVGQRKSSTFTGELGAQVGFFASGLDDADAASDRLPCFTAPDLLYDRNAHAVPFSKVNSGHACGVVDGQGLGVGQNGAWVNFGLAEGAMPLAIHDVGCAGVITQVVEPVVGGVAVSMTYVNASQLRADKGAHDELMNVCHTGAGVARQIDAEIPLSIVTGLEDFPSLDVGGAAASIVDDAVFTSDASPVADGVQPFIAGHRKPCFVKRVRHDDVTFCLTVGQYHNFTIESGLVVKNCIIIDDPHKADEARSDVMRRNVIDWFQNTLESRKNSPSRTPIVLIMQRLHEEDLAGWLLAGGNGEKWEHLNLPAITEAGEALWSAKHSIEQLRLMEQASPYVFAGQYMQRPAPLAGGFFKPDRIEIVDALPAGVGRGVRAWDLAATADGGDSTAGALLYDGKDGFWYIADMVHGQMGPDDVEAALLNTARIDGTGIRIRIPQDPGQAGKAQAKSLTRKLSGWSVTPMTVTGDKAARAMPLAAQVNVGNVRMVRGDWNRGVIEEMRNFPNAKHDDRVDAMADAFNELNGGNFGLLDFVAEEAQKQPKQETPQSWLNHLP